MPVEVKERTRRLRVLLADDDAQDFGRRVMASHPSVRFVPERSRDVLRSMPRNCDLVDVMDALLHPGLEFPTPQLWNPGGVLVRLQVPMIRDGVLQSGELSTVFNEADPGHVAFVAATFRAMQEATKPHVQYWDGRPAPLRIGPAAERWWREDEARTFRDGSVSYVLYRVRASRGPETPVE